MTQVTRRDLMLGSAALGVGSLTTTKLLAKTSYDWQMRELLTTTFKINAPYCEWYKQGWYSSLEDVIDLNMALVRKAPEIFRLDYMMTGPTSIIKGQVVCTMSRALKTEYTLELVQDIKGIQGVDARTELIEIIAYEAALEFKQLGWPVRNIKMCPYIPLEPVKAIDRYTFQPKIGFKTRYGLLRT